jgi:hypothetical protein
LRVGGPHRDRPRLPRRRFRCVATDQFEVVHHERGEDARDRDRAVEGNVDVPGVEGVLVEPEADEAFEADLYGTGREGEAVPFHIAERFESGRKSGVGGECVIDLRP